MSETKFGLTNFSIEDIENEKAKIEDYQEVVKRLTKALKKTWICPQDWNGITVLELKDATVEEFCIWAVQVWPPFKDKFKKALPKKGDFEALFNYAIKMHGICKFPKGSMGIQA